MNTEQKLLRPGDLASRLGVSKSTLWRWRRAHLLPQPLYLGPRIIGWRLEDIDSWLDNLSDKGDI